MKKTEQNNYAGQRFPMWFKFEIKKDHFVVDIASTEPALGLQINTGHGQMQTIRVTEILETRDAPRSGVNHFDPTAKFYKVKAVGI